MIPSIEFWVALSFIFILFIIVLLILFVKRVNRMQVLFGKRETARQEPPNATAPAKEVLALLEPLVEESRLVADSFGEQIREKRKISKDLNDALDARIISINLLLTRASKVLKELEEQQERIRQTSSMVDAARPPVQNNFNVLDQQNQIIDLYYRKEKVQNIAEKLSIPEREVQLVVDLKEKFVAMEKDR